MPKGPDFICFGLQKAGTRWLYHQMAAADGVWMPPIKELNYFSGNTFKSGNLNAVAKHASATAKQDAKFEANCRFFEIFKRGHTNGVDLNWYFELFEPKGCHLSGDVSPGYARMAPSEIEATVGSCPDSKYIFLLRDPVSRFWSGACMGVRKGRVAAQDLMHWDGVSQVLERNNIQANSFPTRVWRRWSELLSPGSLRFWFLDDIAVEPDAVRQDIGRFVGLSGLRSPLPASFNSKSKNQKLNMPPEVRRRLAIYFDDEISEAAELFGGQAIAWKETNRTLTRGAT